ncbi:hypothetical protein LX36DRAFT_398287 [Colletotrichum falcatum]|nr:hypothetical protein LX36DRAFT_398287 [Colletotrichum falcatum]
MSCGGKKGGKEDMLRCIRMYPYRTETRSRNPNSHPPGGPMHTSIHWAFLPCPSPFVPSKTEPLTSPFGVTLSRPPRHEARLPRYI